MKLSAAQVEQVQDQFAAQALPDQHPTVPQLEEVFGTHTFFIGPEGLHVVERTQPTNSGSQEAVVVKLASWADEEKTSLQTHGAQLAGTVELAADDGSDGAR